MSDIIVCKVLDADGEVIAIEITDNAGQQYFVATDPFWEGVRLGTVPASRDGPLKRVEIARLPTQPRPE